jgi:hypothetical protein
MRTLLMGMALCRDLFGWVPPEAVALEMRSMLLLPSACRTVRYALVAHHVVFEPNGPLPFVRLLGDTVRALMLSGSWRTITSHLWRRSLSPKDLRLLAVPDRWFFVYYLLRPLLFAVRQLRA